MLIYEITAIVATDSVADVRERYMVNRRIPDVLATGRFAAAFIARNGNEYRINTTVIHRPTWISILPTMLST